MIGKCSFTNESISSVKETKKLADFAVFKMYHLFIRPALLIVISGQEAFHSVS